MSDEFKPDGEREGYLRLNQKQIKKLVDKGFCYMEINPDHYIKITTDDLGVFEEDYEKIKNYRIENELE